MESGTNKTIPFPSNKEDRLEEAIKEFEGESRDEAALLQKFIDLINDDCDEAYYYAGCICEAGEGNVEKDIDNALFYYDKAIEKFGNLEAYLALGRIYFYGIGVNPDYDRSFDYYSKVDRERDNGISSFMLGKFYLHGLGVEKDIAKARQYFQQAIDNGFVYGIRNMADLEKQQGNYIRSLILKLKAGLKTFGIALKNPKDIRLREG